MPDSTPPNLQSSAERTDEPEPVSTGERAMPPVRTADERATLIEMLDWYREGVVLKARGAAPHHAAATPLRSATSIAGLVKHLALVEDFWFTVRFAGRPEPAPWGEVDWDVDPDWEFHSAADDDLTELIAMYETACERSRAVVAEHELDDIGVDTSRDEFSLRWMLLHLIEETARHLGHLDILRELLDGGTGE